ncbi:acyl carrier protein [Patescibacteria group bacterium]|nr:acyl carrier protein [Patescibacteria group bacterium]HOM77830.1 phosphopantetheine-binding protein [bacterium]
MYLKKIQKIISNRMGIEPEEIEPTSHFEEDLNMGELELMGLIEELEKEFSLELKDLCENVETVEDLITILTEELE